MKNQYVGDLLRGLSAAAEDLRRLGAPVEREVGMEPLCARVAAVRHTCDRHGDTGGLGDLLAKAGQNFDGSTDLASLIEHVRSEQATPELGRSCARRFDLEYFRNSWPKLIDGRVPNHDRQF